MRGLIMDTSGSQPLLALAQNEIVVTSLMIERGRGLSGRFFLELQKLLKTQNISYLAVGMGPGSFAGTRTAVTIAKTLAYAKKLPIRGFPSPLAFIPPTIDTGPFAFLLDAKMGQFALVTGQLPSFEISTTLFKKETLDQNLPKKCPIISDLDCPATALSSEPNPSRIARWACQLPERGQLTVNYLQPIG